jgi:hypothetical protein
MASRKRKYHPTASENAYASTSQTNSNVSINTYVADPDAALVVQAHEADVVRGPQAKIAARSLEVDVNRSGLGTYSTVGDGLIRWGGAGPNTVKRQEMMIEFDGDDEWNDESGAVWVDRYALSDRFNELSSMFDRYFDLACSQLRL